MNRSYILLLISLLIAFVSIIISSRKNGYVALLKVSFKDTYIIKKDRLEDFSRTMFIIAACSIVLGLLIVQNIEDALVFTLINLFFIGYALAWEKLIEYKDSKS